MESLQRIFDLIMSLFQSLSPMLALSFLSLLTALLMLVTFRYTSDQQRIRETKNAIKARLLELWIFRDDVRITLSAQGKLLLLNGRYLKLALKPMMVMIVPLALIVILLEGWFGYRPLRPGEAVIVSMQVSDGVLGLENASLYAGNGVKVETPPLRISMAKEVDWRIRADGPGTHKVTLDLSGYHLEKQVVVLEGLVRVSPSRFASTFWQTLLYPGEPPIPKEFGIERIDISYPTRFIKIFRWEIHWLVVFFVLSIVFAFAFKRAFRVEM